jgi:hypothetical protein
MYGPPSPNNPNNHSANHYTHQNDTPPKYESTVSATPPTTVTNKQDREAKFRQIVDKYEISLDFSQRLQQLQGFKICFVFDDSGSMNSPLMDSPLNNENTLLKATRWDELQYFAKIGLEIATLFDPDGKTTL